jgi:hypothetical protein
MKKNKNENEKWKKNKNKNIGRWFGIHMNRKPTPCRLVVFLIVLVQLKL